MYNLYFYNFLYIIHVHIRVDYVTCHFPMKMLLYIPIITGSTQYFQQILVVGPSAISTMIPLTMWDHTAISFPNDTLGKMGP